MPRTEGRADNNSKVFNTWSRALSKIADTEDGLIFLLWLRSICGRDKIKLVIKDNQVSKELTDFLVARESVWLEIEEKMDTKQQIELLKMKDRLKEQIKEETTHAGRNNNGFNSPRRV
jgi:hypothetical protein